MTTSVIGIYAVAANGTFGNGDDLPWGRMFISDLRWFKHVTTQNPNAVILCGRGTFNSLPMLKDREVHVLSRDIDAKGLKGCWYKGHWTNISDFFDFMREIKRDVIIIGGAEVIRTTLQFMDLIYETTFLHPYDGDVHLDPLPPLMYNIEKSQLVRNLDQTGVDALFKVWSPRKRKNDLSVQAAREKWGLEYCNLNFFKPILEGQK